MQSDMQELLDWILASRRGLHSAHPAPHPLGGLRPCNFAPGKIVNLERLNLDSEQQPFHKTLRALWKNWRPEEDSNLRPAA